MGKMFEQVQSEKFYMQIARQIRNQIREGKLRIGERLPPERSMAEQFGASRASIREALSALEILGLVECRGGHGNFIMADGSEGTIDGELLKKLLMDHDPYEIFEARLELEPVLASMAAERATPEDKQKNREIVARLKELSGLVDSDPSMIPDYMEEDRRYHLEIGRAAHNNVLFMVFSGVNLMMKETHWQALKSKGLAKAENIVAYGKEHEAILDAIVQGNQKRAHVEMRKHIVILRKSLFNV
jgi:GntR family transcriptional repressor for pyruvate dehydrogenase complex